MDTAPKPSKPVNALSRGIAILRYLDSHGEPVGVVQIARDLTINASTCFNLLRTLVHEQLAVFDPITKKYAPGLGTLELARSALKQGGFARLLHPRLEQIAKDHLVTTMIWQLASPSRAVLIDLAEAPTLLRVHFTIGQRLPSLIGAFGRCFAGHMDLPKSQIKKMFKELRWHTPPSFEDYWADVEEAQRTGFAVDIGHYHRNFTTVAAPILDSAGRATMALSAIAFSADIDRDRMQLLADDLRAVTRDATTSFSKNP